MEKLGIHSVPRSGSTWLGSIMDSHPEVAFRMQPLFSYAFKHYLNKKSTSNKISSFFKEIIKSEDNFINQFDQKEKGLIPVFKKSNYTHVCYKEVRYHHILPNLLSKDKEVKVIGLIRNPFSVINSWLKAPKEFKAELGWKIEDEWKFAPSKNQDKLEEYNGYEKWKEVTYLFLKLKEQYPNRFYLLCYEDLLQNPVAETSKIFEFAKLEMGQQTQEFLKASTSRNDIDPYSVYKTKDIDKDWEKELPEYIIQEIKDDRGFQELNQIFRWI